MSCLFRIPLHVSGALPKKFGKPHGKFGCDKLAFGQDIARTLPRDAEHPSVFRYGFSEYGNCCLAKYRFRARRTMIGIAAHDGLQAISFEFRGINIVIEEFESGACLNFVLSPYTVRITEVKLHSKFCILHMRPAKTKRNLNMRRKRCVVDDSHGSCCVSVGSREAHET